MLGRVGSNGDDDDLADYLSGRRLFGDDMSPEEIAHWYADEAQAYKHLKAGHRTAGSYDYHALNALHGYRQLPKERFRRIMSFGGATGDELRPIAARADSIVVVEPADYSIPRLEGTTVEFRKPLVSGAVPAGDGEFDLITCLGALHHVPNVSAVVRDFVRVLRPGGFALIREPIVSMGDWRYQRVGLTRRERGIPLAVFDRIIADAGFSVLRRRRCVHALTPWVGRFLNLNWFNSPALTALDAFLSSIPPGKSIYHPTTWWQKLQPSAVFYVLRAPSPKVPSRVP